MTTLTIVLLLCSFSFPVFCKSPYQKATGPLPDYVYRPDPYYNWEVYSRKQENGFTTVYLNMTSQRWYDYTLTQTPIWQHFLTVHIPDTILYPDAAFMFISGGSNPGPPGNRTHIFRMGQYANKTGIVAACLTYVPNQPIIFENDGHERYEDEIIAWTWRRFYNETSEGGWNPEILLRMPMCKGAVRAMDAIQEFILQENGNLINRFMIAGESKRGWTTWLTGAIDSRVIAMAPVVLSLLNLRPIMHKYYQSLGGWPFAMFDYWVHQIMGLIDMPETQLMANIIDPYEYRQYMTMPKMMISGASDEFFMPDDYDYFFDDLIGEKYIWLIENSGHDVDDSPSKEQYWEMLQTFFLGVLQNYQIPQMVWSKNENGTHGTIAVNIPVTPVSIVAYSAPSNRPDRRDWRLYELAVVIPVETNVTWTAKPVTQLSAHNYFVEYENPPSGYLAFFIKVVLPGPDGRVYHMTTEANIIPAGFPHADCFGYYCQDMLV